VGGSLCWVEGKISTHKEEIWWERIISWWMSNAIKRKEFVWARTAEQRGGLLKYQSCGAVLCSWSDRVWVQTQVRCAISATRRIFFLCLETRNCCKPSKIGELCSRPCHDELISDASPWRVASCCIILRWVGFCTEALGAGPSSTPAPLHRGKKTLFILHMRCLFNERVISRTTACKWERQDGDMYRINEKYQNMFEFSETNWKGRLGRLGVGVGGSDKIQAYKRNVE
jgi:hypothetical protein